MNEKSSQEQTRAAILIGSAQEGQIQPKLKEMKNFLQSDQGGSYTEEEICLLASCPDEQDLKRLIKFNAGDKTLYYICTTYVTQDWEQKLWLSENEISKSLFEKNEKDGILDVQTIYDVDRNFVDFDEEEDFSKSDDYIFMTGADLRKL